MKKMNVLTALLLTAILCIGLASCRTGSANKNEKHETPSDEGIGYTTKYYDPYDNYYTYKTEPPVATPVITTATNTTVNSSQTTTAPAATTAPVTVTTTTVSPTTTETTTATTTVAPTTTAPTTTAPTTAAPTTEPTTLPDIADTNFEIAATKQLNARRAENGLQPLTRSKELSRAAKIRAKEIATSFSHTRPDGSLWYTVSDAARGENLAKDYYTPEDVMAAWMESEGHKDNILTSYYHTVGTGCYYDSATDTYYWVQLFGI